MDDWWDCRKTIHRPVKHPDNPMLETSEPWEGPGPQNGTVLYDEREGLFRLWANSFDDTKRNPDGSKGPCCGRSHPTDAQVGRAGLPHLAKSQRENRYHRLEGVRTFPMHYVLYPHDQSGGDSPRAFLGPLGIANSLTAPSAS
jgi:hypothetical protein